MAKVAFLFPGQGAQSVGMAGEVCQNVPAAKELFDRAAEILGYDLLDICVHGPAEKLNATDVSQPALFVASLAAVEKLRVEDPALIDACSAAAGLSLGEYTALSFAGAISFEDGLRVVKTRGEAMQAAAQATPSSMASVIGLDQDSLQAIIRESTGVGYARISNYLCPGNLVVSGVREAVAEICRQAEAAGAMQIVPLAVAGAFHTELMKPAEPLLAQALAIATIHPPRIPVISNVDAKPHFDPDEIRDVLVKQVLGEVLWEDSIRHLLAEGVDKFVELGPGRVLAGLLRRIQRRTDITSVQV
ncbi:ACP S-malonyltransferase [bacterium]|nr:ACP S-malonyltransferase [bacterium]